MQGTDQTISFFQNKVFTVDSLPQQSSSANQFFIYFIQELPSRITDSAELDSALSQISEHERFGPTLAVVFLVKREMPTPPPQGDIKDVWNVRMTFNEDGNLWDSTHNNQMIQKLVGWISEFKHSKFQVVSKTTKSE